jgi:asparagine synthase (glutamine-hydrolysing)
MCGIAGIWGQADLHDVRNMLDLLAHRGPDAFGLCVGNADVGVVGHRRLSIVDPAGGDQPIYSATSRSAIVTNGEIYNFPQLLPELAQRHIFRTGSDSEAVLHLYDDHGPRSVEYLAGMYAFAIVDGGRLFVARDPIGIKPLYYGERDGAFIFASELKALAGRCDNVREFPPGAYYLSDAGFSSFYSLPDAQPQQADAGEHIRMLRTTLEAAVASHLMSDVPLGAFLSGGLDSSIIAALIRRHTDKLHTFAVGVEGSPDLLAARRVADHLGTIHHEYIMTPAEIQAKLPEILYWLESFDQDLVRSAIPCYFTSRLAASEVKVILTGEGADELFAGYTYHKAIAGEDSLHRELRRSITTLHNINLQRVDRMTMAHSIEGRVPFLDLQMVELGLRIPAALKLPGAGAKEKWVLRKAFEDLLPPEIAWRDKEQFDEGSGTADLTPRLFAHTMSAAEAQAYRQRFPDTHLRSAEECHYHRVLCDVFEHPEAILANVARWAERPAHMSNKAASL